MGRPDMMKLSEFISGKKLQYQAFVGLSVVVLSLTGLVYSLDSHVFQQLLGGMNPLVAGLLIVVLGFVLFSFLLSKGWFAFYRRPDLKGLIYSSAIAAFFALVAILADFNFRLYPASVNVPFPKSLLYYPAMGFYAEVVFQILPLTLLMIVLTRFSKETSKSKIMWVSIIGASLIEPVFQAVLLFSGNSPLWPAAFEFVRLSLFMFSQLAFFRRYDFATMYWFRIVYYILWHVVWGYLRLGVLF